MRNNKRLWNVLLASLALLGTLAAGLPALATDLPPGLVNYLKEKDPQVKIRFDGLVLFSNGQLYVPVFPQALTLNPDPDRVVSMDPPKTDYPDIIEFDNQLFLLRLVPTTSGKLTLPRRDNYPLPLKQGLLPQDLILPKGLSIPAELQVVLGGLPYQSPTGSDEALLAREGDEIIQTRPTDPQRPVVTDPLLLYLADMVHNRVLALDPNNGQPVWDLPLNCVPKAMSLSADGGTLYTTCLTTNEVVVIDTRASLVKTRLNTQSRPRDMVLLPGYDRLVTSNPLEKSLSVYDTRGNLQLQPLVLPGAPGALAARFSPPVVFVADANEGKIYELDVVQGKLLRTLNAKGQLGLMKNISGLTVEETPNGLGRLWLFSRKQGQLQVVDLFTEKLVLQQTIGDKPVQFVKGPDQSLFVLCAQGDRLEWYDMPSLTRKEPVLLPAGSFPTGMGVDALGRFAYIATAANEKLYVVDLRNRDLLRSYPYQARAVDAVLFDNRKVASQLERIEALRRLGKGAPAEKKGPSTEQAQAQSAKVQQATEPEKEAEQEGGFDKKAPSSSGVIAPKLGAKAQAENAAQDSSLARKSWNWVRRSLLRIQPASSSETSTSTTQPAANDGV